MYFYLYIFLFCCSDFSLTIIHFSVSFASLYVCHIFIIFFEYYYKWIKFHLTYSLPWL